MIFSETVQAHLAGRELRASLLAFFDFLDAPTRVWPGHGTLTTNDANQWLGIGAWGSVDDLNLGVFGTEARQQTFSLSGIVRDDGTVEDLPKPIIEIAMQERRADYADRSALLYLQFFDAAWQPLDTPYPIWAGWMWSMKITMDGPSGRGVDLICEGLFKRRRRPGARYYSDSDQQRIYPGDKLFEYMPSLADAEVVWP